ncbi:hypothetical protein EOD42_14770 [Rhodovarius crocodyli]|uniref:Uncharacterized protein n=1 Tax=Rhodovarius crocodyli TaxID=1979269 RepID=A0A437MFG5_9PROT|nr:hypothetical protein [Rhodovarius crocodyli]RVT96365.1 hypothetical protein EOD42_14770 [Rhodovarius crocodyli]
MRESPVQGPPAVTVHGMDHVRAVLQLQRPATLLSAGAAASAIGAPGFLAMLRAGGWDGRLPAILDCGTAPGHALGALLAGVPQVVLAPCPARAGLMALHPGRILAEAPPSLDMATWNPRRGTGWIEAWLANRGG